MKIKILDEYSYQTLPITNDMIEINDSDIEKVGNGYKFDLTTNTIVEDTTPQAIVEQETKSDRVSELKVLLNQTDYQAIKYAEGLITEEEYAPIKAQRQEWRDEINVLEQQLEV